MEELSSRRRAARARAVQRRRLTLLAAVAFAGGAAVGASSGGPNAPGPRASGPATRSERAPARRVPAARAALARQVGELIVLRFEGPDVPGYVRRELRAGRASGAILFHDNVRAPEQLRELTRTLRRAGGPGTLVAVDQEGGPIRIVPWAPPARAAPAQGAAGSAGTDARAAARALRAVGINVSLAPVADADVPAGPGSAIAGRQLGGTPDAVARTVAAAVRGWRAGGVAPAVKHFPGLGGALVNTDRGSAAVRRSRAALDADLAPFAAAVRATGPVDAAAEASLRAGVDLMLTTGKGSAIHVYRRLLASARRDPALRARVHAAAGRVERLRRKL